ncbi:MAG: dTDP-4-dehydrorhamnose reductase, partial [Thermodesulfobacteriota bacterium]
SNGLLGTECNNILKQQFEVINTDRNSLDITKETDVQKMLNKYKPDIVLNCAAYTQVDKCESNRDLAYNVNVTGPKILANNLKSTGGKLIHISTDYVFNGKKRLPNGYKESDSPEPVNYYGLTKFRGEQEIMSNISNHLIIRTSWLYGFHSVCFPKTILKLALNPEIDEIKIVNDQFGSPTSTNNLANTLKLLILKDATGLYHISSEGFSTWHEFAKYFLEMLEIQFNIIPCTTEEYPTDAKRPVNSALSSHKLENEGHGKMENWKDQLERFVTNYKEKLINEAKSY